MSDSEYGILDVIYESVKNLNKAGLISDERVEMFYVACFEPEEVKDGSEEYWDAQLGLGDKDFMTGCDLSGYDVEKYRSLSADDLIFDFRLNVESTSHSNGNTFMEILKGREREGQKWNFKPGRNMRYDVGNEDE